MNMFPEFRQNWLKDISAGIVVFLVALPLCLGIALASGAPLISGVVAGIVGGIVVGLISGSHTSVSGPAAGLTAIIATQIDSLGSFQVFLAALIIAGVLQIILGVAKFGFIAAFFPSSVIKGLLAAIGIILVLKQIPHLGGWDSDAEGEMAFWQPDQENTFSEIINLIFNYHTGALLIGLLSLLLLITWERIPKLKKSAIPAPLIVVLLGIVLQLIFSTLGNTFAIGVEHRVSVPVSEDLDDLLAFFMLPDFSAFLSPSVYFTGFVLALVATLETLLNLEAVDKIDPQQRISPPNRELIAQGVGNTLLGFIGGLPVTSVVIRSSVNINAGSRTRFSAIVHGLLLFSCVAIVPYGLNAIPLSCLAAILIVTGIKLASPKVFKQMWSEGINQFFPFVVTVSAIVFTDLLVGVMVGLATSVLFILHSNLKRPLMMTKENHFGSQVTRIELANQVSFLNRAALSQAFDAVPKRGHLLVDATHTDYIDADILDILQDLKHKKAPARHVKLSLVGFKPSYNIANHIQFQEHATPELQKHITPQQVLQILVEGNERVRKGQRLKRDLGRQINATSSGQFPLGVVLSCIDSRASVELIFDLGIGDIFSIRMAGNVISEKVLGSMEFACAIAKAKLVVVMGHTRCGAVTAALEFQKSGLSVSDTTGCKHLNTIVSDIQQVVYEDKSAIPSKESASREAFEDTIIKRNVEHCIKEIRAQSSMLNQLVSEGAIDIVGCVYDVRTGMVDFIDR